MIALPIWDLSCFHINFLNIYLLFIFSCAGSWLQHAGSFIAMLGLFVAEHGLFSSCGMWDSEHMSPVVVAHRLSNNGVLAQLPHSMWNLSPPQGSNLSPALESRFLTTGPTGNSFHINFKIISSSSVKSTVGILIDFALNL